MTSTTSRMGNFYNEKSAASELRRYRQKGPDPIDSGVDRGAQGRGRRGRDATRHRRRDRRYPTRAARCRPGPRDQRRRVRALSRCVAKGERPSRLRCRVTYRHGDFVELAESVPVADIVTLDRVLNVYPDWERLTELSAQHAQRLYGLVYPRNTLMVRLVTFAMNVVLRLLRKPVRASVRPGEAIDLVARERGLVRHFSQSVGPAWQVAVYRRSRP